MNLSNLTKEELLAMVEKLTAENEKLEAEKRELNAKLDKMIEKYENKLELNKKILADRYAPKSEKTINEEAINEGALEYEKEMKKEKKPRKAPTEYFLEDLKKLANDEIVLDYDFDRVDIKKENVKEFGESVSYKIESVQTSFNVVKVVRPKYKDKNHIYQALVNDPFPHSALTPSLAANIITMKYQMFISLYRYSEYLKTIGLNIPVYNLYNYVDRTMELLDPLYQKLIVHLFNNKANVIHCDETPLKVIESEKDKCYMFVYTTSFWDNPIYIYEFSETRKTEKLQEHMKNYKGYLISDGYSGYNFYGKIQRCFVHVRRYFNDCLKPLKEKDRKKSPAYKVVQLINKIFHYEAEYKDAKFTADQIKKKRNEKDYKAVIKELDTYVKSLTETKNSLLLRAVNYYLNMKDHLYTFLENGHVDISNNLAERTVKPFVIARKNFLFCKTADGAVASSKAFSIVQTARANGLIVEAYLKYVIENIGTTPVDELLPWSEKLPNEIKISV